jgi:Domain of unknown function (DUF4387)
VNDSGGLVPLVDLASVIRSKNASPFELTLDIIFREEQDYLFLKGLGFFTQELVARLYNVPVEDVLTIVHFDPARAIKANLKRAVPAGRPGDTDVYGAQQHAPLLGLRVPARS